MVCVGLHATSGQEQNRVREKLVTICVECHAGYRSGQEPRAFTIGACRLQVVAVEGSRVDRAGLPLLQGHGERR